MINQLCLLLFATFPTIIMGQNTPVKERFSYYLPSSRENEAASKQKIFDLLGPEYNEMKISLVQDSRSYSLTPDGKQSDALLMLNKREHEDSLIITLPEWEGFFNSLKENEIWFCQFHGSVLVSPRTLSVPKLHITALGYFKIQKLRADLGDYIMQFDFMLETRDIPDNCPPPITSTCPPLTTTTKEYTTPCPPSNDIVNCDLCVTCESCGSSSSSWSTEESDSGSCDCDSD